MAGAGYASFYVLVTNAVSAPDPGVPIPPELSHGYLVPFAAYGPMAVWPDVEFYFPSMNLAGYLSVGNVLLFASLGFLTAFAAALLMRNISWRRKVGKGALTPFGGAVLASLSTNACCCCSPVLYPLVAILFGGAVPGAIADSLVNPQSPISNLFVLATLACLVVSVILLTRQCQMSTRERQSALMTSQTRLGSTVNELNL